ncbi:MAG: galactose ABC transporter substrate-binding protein [Lachnospirales bacterium]
MRRYFYLITLVFIAFFSFLYLNDKKVIDDEVKIGVFAYKKADTFISLITGEMEKEVKSINETGEKVKINISYGKNNQLTQNDEVDRFLALEYNVLCVNLVDRTNASLIIDKAIENDTPLIFFNREPVSEDLYRNSNIYYLGSKPKLSGIIQGELVVEAYEKNKSLIDKNNDDIINYAMIEGELGHQDAIYRTEYSIKTINANGIETNKVVSGIGNFDRDQGNALMEQWLIEGYDIELVICNNDEMALGALEACKNSNVTIPIVGIDGVSEAISEVEKGNLLGTVISDYELYGETLFKVAYALGTKSTIPSDIVVEDGKYIWIPWEGILNPLYK